MQQSVQNNTALQRNIHNAERQQLSTRLSGSDSHKNLLIHLQYGTAYPRQAQTATKTFSFTFNMVQHTQD